MMLGNMTEGATSYHAVDVEPDWSSSLERTVQIGNHIFYRPMPRTRAS
jgi:spore germination cell wall hydrolase CwlJ-like protein